MPRNIYTYKIDRITSKSLLQNVAENSCLIALVLPLIFNQQTITKQISDIISNFHFALFNFCYIFKLTHHCSNKSSWVFKNYSNFYSDGINGIKSFEKCRFRPYWRRSYFLYRYGFVQKDIRYLNHYEFICQFIAFSCFYIKLHVAFFCIIRKKSLQSKILSRILPQKKREATSLTIKFVSE